MTKEKLVREQFRGNVLTVLITGTNGKTTIGHLLKHIFGQVGIPIYSNIHWEDDREERAEEFLQTLADCRVQAEPAVFLLEVDEGDFAYFAEKTRPDLAIITNLSRNQLYLYGELRGLANGFLAGLNAVPTCRLICCGDDPLVAAVAQSVDRPDRVSYYGMADPAGGPAEQAGQDHYFIESPHCGFCGSHLEYKGLAFSNYGNYACPQCDFKRPQLDLEFTPLAYSLRDNQYAFKFAPGPTLKSGQELKLSLQLPALLNAYNAAAAALLALQAGLSPGQIRRGLETCLPPRGRFERFIRRGQEICLLRGENPEALNATLAWALAQSDFGGLILTLDDPEKNHGGDISWLWDVLFEKLPFAGRIGVSGNRANDLALRLVYAGVETARLSLGQDTGLLGPPVQPEPGAHPANPAARLKEEDLLVQALADAQPKTLYWLMDKTAAHRLRPKLKEYARSEIDLIHQELADRPPHSGEFSLADLSESLGFTTRTPSRATGGLDPESLLSATDSVGLDSLHQAGDGGLDRAYKYSLSLAYLYPDELNLYGDRGNVVCLHQRAKARGIDLKIRLVGRGDKFQADQYDLVFMGGGQDSDQDIVYPDFVDKAQDIRRAVEAGLVFLCICGAYQLMGKNYITADGKNIEGLGILDLETRGLGKRMVGDLVFTYQADRPSPVLAQPKVLVGYENHGGETFLGPKARPMGQVLAGFGNNSQDQFEGCVYKNLYGTYAHGALLPRNPKFADHLLSLAWQRRYPGLDLPDLAPDWSDQLAEACRQEIFDRLGIEVEKA